MQILFKTPWHSVHSQILIWKLPPNLQVRIWLVFALLLVPLSTKAQMAGYGAIAGTITDSTGAVIPNAKVTATQVAQNTSTVRSSTSVGAYNVTPLTPGLYTVSVSAKGFEGFVQENVTVNALETVTLNIKLNIGTTEQTITVTEAPPVLETSDATLGAVMDNEMYSSLPLLMGAGGNADQRRATDFASLMPGVQNTYAASTSANSTDASGGVNGSNPYGGTQEMYIDGVDLPSSLGVGDPRTTWTAFGMDSVDQFQVQTIGYSAQYAGQGVQNYSIKQGSNQFHGSLYEYSRNKFLDAWAANNKIPTVTGLVPAGQKCSSSTLSADTSWCKLGGVKPEENMNEFGIVLSGPIVKNKLFLFYNYGQYRYQKGSNPTIQTLPTYNMMGYDNSGNALGYADYTNYQIAQAGSASAAQPIYDPATQTQPDCSTTCQRTAFANNQIPQARFSQTAQYINQYLLPMESIVNQSMYGNNVAYGVKTGLSNWYQTGRLDYNPTDSHQLSLIVAFGRQSSTGLNSGGTLPPPFNTTQTYHPETNVDILKEVWTVTPHMVNQASAAFSRYVSDSTTPNMAAQYAASQMGLLNTPAGQASFFPQIKWSGASGYTPGTWGGYAWNNKGNDTYTFTDNLQWDRGRHSLTFGGQYIIMQYDVQSPTTDSSPMTYNISSAQTLGYYPVSSSSYGKSIPNSGAVYASYMLGAISSASVSVNTPELSPRWHDPSIWVQDNWKAMTNLTVNLGLRWDIWPPVVEKNNNISWLNPTATNPYTGNQGAFNVAGGNSNDGYHTGVRNLSSTWLKNVAPRLGLAYQLNSKTVVRASYGLSFARGNWISDPGQSGSPSITGLTMSDNASPTTPAGYGFGSNEPNFYWDATACGANGVAGDGLTACGFTGTVSTPAATLPSGISSMAAFGAYETAAMSGKNAASLMYWDSYYGSRTPEYENWSFGIERQINKDTSLSISYVGSEGHFLATNAATGPYWNNKLSESWAAMSGYSLASAKGTSYAACSGASCAYPLIGQRANVNGTNGIQAAQSFGFTPQNPYSTASLQSYYMNNGVIGYFTPFPQYSGVSNGTSYIGNTNYHALQVVASQRPAHGLNWMVSYTYSKNIDDMGTFRVYDNSRRDRSLSAASQPQNLTTTAVWHLPLGKGHIFGDSMVYRSIVGNWAVSGIGVIRSGLPIIVTGSGCAGNNVLSQCMPSIVAGKTGRQYKWGKTATGQNVSWDNSNPNYIGKVDYVNPQAFVVTTSGTCATNTSTGAYHTYQNADGTAGNYGAYGAYNVCGGPEDYVPGTAPRVAPLGMFGQKNVNLDMALKRTFPIYHEWKLAFEADLANVANHVQYKVPSCTVSSSISSTTFCNVTGISNLPRETQLSARLSW